jgi:hypothetical protein
MNKQHALFDQDMTLLNAMSEIIALKKDLMDSNLRQMVLEEALWVAVNTKVSPETYLTPGFNPLDLFKQYMHIAKAKFEVKS